MEKTNGKIAIAIVVMFVVALSIVGGTYAYFVAGVKPNADGVNVTVKAGTLKITYDKGTELDAQGIVPGWASDGDKYYDPKHSVSVVGNETHISAASLTAVGEENVSEGSTLPVEAVTFEVENPKQQGSEEDPLEAYYAIVLDIEKNTIVDNENFKVTLDSKDVAEGVNLADGTVLGVDETDADYAPQVVSDVITIAPNAKHVFSLSAAYDNITSAQTQGKAVKFAVRVVGLNHIDTNGDNILDKYVDANGQEYTAMN